MAVRFNRNFNVNRVVKRLVRTTLALYVGGTIFSTFGDVMMCTNSPFYDGISLIGWTITDAVEVNASTIGAGAACNTTTPLNGVSAGTYNNLITSSSGSGVLAVVGIIAIAQVVTEFINW